MSICDTTLFLPNTNKQEIQSLYNKKIFSFDVESNGLQGQGFSVAAIVTNEKGEVIDDFIGRCPINETVVAFVKNHVLPEMKDIEETDEDFYDLLKNFGAFYKKYKDTTEIIVHMGYPVETNFLKAMYENKIIGEFDSPFPLIDISACKDIYTSVDLYNEKNNLTDKIPKMKGGTHNPLYDCYVAAIAYRDFREKEIIKEKITELYIKENKFLL